MKYGWLTATIFAALVAIGVGVVALAQDQPPPPYAGLKNPFPWTDAQAQAAGKLVYGQSCAGCHGVTGSGVAAFDFSAPSYAQKLEARPDFYFWVFSEGRLSQGMPLYKSLLSEEQRWQTLDYIWSLGTAAPLPVPLPPIQPLGAMLSLSVPEQGKTGQALPLTAVLIDSQGKPVSGATVKFFLSVDFFTQGLMEIGEAVTNGEGEATLRYVPRAGGEIQVTARYETAEIEADVSITETGEIFYQTEVGMQFPAFGPEIFVGPESARQLGEMGNAPMTALHLPGGIFSWLWLFVGVLMLVWGTYFVVMYHILGISTVRKPAVANNRTVPLAGLAIVFLLGLLMVLMVITGPYSHFHLVRVKGEVSPPPSPVAPLPVPAPVVTPPPAQSPVVVPIVPPASVPAPIPQVPPVVAPAIPHQISGFSDCLVCHGPSGMVPFPASHSGRTNNTCTTCHNPAPVPAPVIPHLTTGVSDCLLCHGPSGIIPFPASHAGRMSVTCLVCHVAVPVVAERIPHRIEGFSDCLSCHGPSGEESFPRDHIGRTNITCTLCHPAGR